MDDERLKKILAAWAFTDGYTITPDMNQALEEAWMETDGFGLDPEMSKALSDKKEKRDG